MKSRHKRSEESDGVYWDWQAISVRMDTFGIHLIVNRTGNHEIESPTISAKEATAAADMLRAAAVEDGSSCAGKSILELLWEELDTIVDRLMTGQAAADGRDPGRAEGVAYCIAVFTNPYRPNIEGVREQSTERWEAGNPE